MNSHLNQLDAQQPQVAPPAVEPSVVETSVVEKSAIEKSAIEQTTFASEKHPMAVLAGRFYTDKRLTSLTILLIIAAGISSWIILPRMEDPLLTQRAANVTTLFPGADAEKVEALVTEKIEEKLRDLPDIKRIRSSSRAGVSFITIELRDDIYDADPIWPKVRGKIEDAISLLPPGAGRPLFDDLDISAYAWIAGISWNSDQPAAYGALRRIARELRDELLSLQGTKSVDLFGDPSEEILIELDPDQLALTGVSAAAVAQRLNQADVKSASGILRSDTSEMVVQFRNEFKSLESIENASIQTGQVGQELRLKDLAKSIRRSTPEPVASQAMIDGHESVIIGVMLRGEYRIDRWTENARKILDEFRLRLPSDVRVDIVMEQDNFVSQRMASLGKNLLMGVGAVWFATFILMGWRSSLLVTLTLPLASLMVLTGMRMLNIPIHQMSVTGLILAMGLLIDNAIIAADEIQIGIKRGLSPLVAAKDMVARLFAPLVASTLTTIFAFAPIGLMEGPSGEFVGSIAYTVTLAVLCSLFLSLTILPAAAGWLQSSANFDKLSLASGHYASLWERTLVHGISIDWLTKIYRRFLCIILARPWLGVTLGCILPLLGFVSATQLTEQFFPPADRSQFHIEVELQPQSTIAQTKALAMQVDQELRLQPRVQQTTWFFGESAPSFYYNIISRFKNTPHFAQCVVNLDNDRDTGDLIRQLQSQFDVKFPAARLLVRQLEQGPPFDAPVEVRVFGPDLDQLNELGEQIRLLLANVPKVVHTKTLLSETRPRAELSVQSQQARWAGLTEQAIADQLFSRFEGLQAGSIIEQTELIPVRVRVASDRRASLNDLRETTLIASMAPQSEQSSRSLAAQSSPLLASSIQVSTVASAELSSQRALIAHYNGLRQNEVKAYLVAGTLPAQVQAALQQKMQVSDFHLPAGYRLEFGGEASERNDAVTRLMANVSILAIGMVASIVLALNSFRLSVIIGLVAMMSVGLGLGALWFFGYPFGFMAIIGTMGLIGVAINDSIVVASSLKGHVRELSTTVETVIEVTRHVLATTATTIAGFFPLIYSGGKFWPPLAVAIGAGVAGATFIAIVFVPSMMRMLYRTPKTIG